MELVMRLKFTAMAALALLVAMVFPAAIIAQSSPEPAMAPTSDGVAIDHGIAYGLMLAALLLCSSAPLLLTYIIH